MIKRWAWLVVLPWSIAISSGGFVSDGETPTSSIFYKGRHIENMDCVYRGSFCEWQSDFIEAMNDAHEWRTHPHVGVLPQYPGPEDPGAGLTPEQKKLVQPIE